MSYDGGYDIVGELEITAGSYHVMVDRYFSTTGALYRFGEELQECYLYIQDVAAVIWSWYSYGEEHTKHNRFRIKYTKESGNVIIRQEEGFSGIISATHINAKCSYAVEIC